MVHFGKLVAEERRFTLITRGGRNRKFDCNTTKNHGLQKKHQRLKDKQTTRPIKTYEGLSTITKPGGRIARLTIIKHSEPHDYTSGYILLKDFT